MIDVTPIEQPRRSFQYELERCGPDRHPRRGVLAVGTQWRL